MMVNEHSVRGDSGVQTSLVMEKNDLPTEQSFTQEVVNSMEEKGCSMEEVQLAKEMLENFKNGEEPPTNLRNIERKRLKEKVDKVNKVLAFIETKDITHTNELLLAAGRVVAKRLGVKPKQRSRGSVPWWKKRLEGQVTQLRKDISRLERMKSVELSNTAICEGLERGYPLNKKRLPVVLEELKQSKELEDQEISRQD